VELVGLAAIEISAFGIDISRHILGPGSDHFLYHRRCHTNGGEVEQDSGIQVSGAILQELMAAADKDIFPVAIRVHLRFRFT
jgi:hypothetical protein